MSLIDPDLALRDALVVGGVVQVTVRDDPSLYLVAESRAAEIAVPYRLMLDGPDGRTLVPEESIAVTACDDGRVCWVIAMAPLARPPTELVLVATTIDHESRATILDVGGPAAVVTTHVVGGGRGLAVSVDDPVSRQASRVIPGWSRRFDMIALPGACGGPPPEDEPRWRRAASAVELLEVVMPEVPDPAVCLLVRPTWPRGAPPVTFRSVAPTAEIEVFDHVYVPPVEVSPLVWVLVSDLQLPSETGCARNEARLSAAIGSAAQAITAEFGAAVGSLELPLERLAVADGRACQQAVDRRLDVDGILARIDAAVDARFGEDTAVRALVVYANNLDTEASDALLEDFDVLVRRAEADRRRPVALFSVSPPRGGVGPAVGGVEFAASSEPAFAASLLAALKNVWPFRTVVHAPDTRVPLVPPELRSRFELYRIVTTAPPVVPFGTPVAEVLAPDADGPAYTVALPPSVLMPAAQFSTRRVVLQWEGCTRYCNQPRDGQRPPSSWTHDR